MQTTNIAATPAFTNSAASALRSNSSADIRDSGEFAGVLRQCGGQGAEAQAETGQNTHIDDNKNESVQEKQQNSNKQSDDGQQLIASMFGLAEAFTMFSEMQTPASGSETDAVPTDIAAVSLTPVNDSVGQMAQPQQPVMNHAADAGQPLTNSQQTDQAGKTPSNENNIQAKQTDGQQISQQSGQQQTYEAVAAGVDAASGREDQSPPVQAQSVQNENRASDIAFGERPADIKNAQVLPADAQTDAGQNETANPDNGDEFNFLGGRTGSAATQQAFDASGSSGDDYEFELLSRTQTLKAGVDQEVAETGNAGANTILVQHSSMEPTDMMQGPEAQVPQQQAITQQVFDHVAGIEVGENNQVTFSLRPDSLGSVKITVEGSGQDMVVTIQTDNQKVKEALSGSLDQLATSLGVQNAKSDQIKVVFTQQQDFVQDGFLASNSGSQEERHHVFSQELVYEPGQADEEEPELVQTVFKTSRFNQYA